MKSTQISELTGATPCRCSGSVFVGCTPCVTGSDKQQHSSDDAAIPSNSDDAQGMMAASI